MKTVNVKWFGRAAAAGALALAIAAPAAQAQTFNDHQRGGQNQVDTRGQGVWNGSSDRNSGQNDRADNRSNGQYDRRDNGSNGQYDRNRDGRSQDRATSARRDNERFSVQGRVTSFSRERGGYRVQLDRGRDSYFVPESYFRGHNLRVGISVILGGVFRGGAIDINAVNWPNDGGYGRGYESGYVSGIVERIDYRDGTMLLRDDRSGRMVTADLGRDGRALDSIRRGDYVDLSGDWSRRGIFEIARIDNVRPRY